MNLDKLYRLVPGSIRSRLTPRLKSAMKNFGVKRVEGFLMDLDPSEWFQNQLWRGASFEQSTIKLIRRLLASGDTYVDVGAHVGYQTLVARIAIGQEGLVIAVEPQPENCARILRNWSINGFANVIVYPAAISNLEHTLTLQEQAASDRARLSLNGPSLAGEMPQRFSVPARRLDMILAEQKISKVRLMKVDTEGHELEVIQGLGDRLKDIDHLIIEVWDPELPNYIELQRILVDAGFTLKNVRGEDWRLPEPLPEINLWAARVDRI